MQPFVKKLISSYDHGEDEFSDIDQDMMNIVRMPRIGRGKHNIHFDPETSPQHAVLAELAQNAHFSDLLTQHMGTPCTLRESGISMTRPYNANITVKAAVPIEGKYAKKPSSAAEDDARVEEGNEEQDVAAGEGMEWHSDGPRGEFTILMALEDVSAEQGSLRVVPASHRVYVDGQGHTEVKLFN